ncbi:MAG: gephyrin-like molybdotransferase Glp [Acidobacteriota bacterium]
MLNYETALKKLLEAAPEAQSQRLPLEEVAGRVLAAPLRADHDLPPFDKSFMDGFALRSADASAAPVRLQVTGVQGAGPVSRGLSVKPGTAVQIMTGAPLPEGADAVQMVEKTRRISERQVEILVPVEAGNHVAAQASEVRTGDTVLEAGQTLGPPEIAVLAVFGQSQVEVFRGLTAVIFSTGDELVPVDQVPDFGQIRNSNAPMLASQCRRLGVEVRAMPHLPDSPQAVQQALAEGLAESDAVIFSGGVSAGEFDFVHKVLGQAGLEVQFHKVAIQPGKPVLLATDPERSKMVFGLPGNPVSAFVTFEIFVRPALRKWMGHRQWGLYEVSGRLTRPLRHKPGRLLFKPARTAFDDGEWRIQPIDTKGSADIVGFSRADSLLLIPADAEQMKSGDLTRVLLLPDHCDLQQS